MTESKNDVNYRNEVIDSLAYLENSSCEVDANYFMEVVVMGYIRELEAELGLPVDREADERYYPNSLRSIGIWPENTACVRLSRLTGDFS